MTDAASQGALSAGRSASAGRRNAAPKNGQPADERRRKQEEEARDKAERQAIAAYWDSLTPEQQEELQAQADAKADPADLARETGVLKRIGQQIRRSEHIRDLLRSHQQQAENA